MHVTFAVRREVDLRAPELPKGVPLEVALPWRLGDFLEQMDDLPRLEHYLIENGIHVASLHATQGKLTDDAFISWALPTVKLARKVGARIVVFHPNNAAKTEKFNLQLVALSNLKRLQRESGGVVVAIETFAHAKRVLTPEEVVTLKLPLVVDVSHLEPARTMTLIETYHRGIVGIHLSEVRWHDVYQKEHTHMPAGPICEKVLEKLRETKWRGVITLEYLSEFHELMFEDRDRLEAEWSHRSF
jgi:sugar phosphate isomerase/epimerase